MISIINYGLGNLFSIVKAFERLGIGAKVISESREIIAAEKIILPGVGHFGAAMEKIKKMDLIGALEEKVMANQCPILGICLGMQLMTKKSEEGGAEGLGWFEAETIKFNAAGVKIPHMGWNTVEFKPNNPLFENIDGKADFYFAHSYYVKLNDKNNLIGETEYGIKFASAIRKGKIFGVQFHPEKSHRNGLQLLKNFNNI